MRVMVMVKATPGSERGDMPTEQLIREMGEYNESLAKAGIHVDVSDGGEDGVHAIVRTHGTCSGRACE